MAKEYYDQPINDQTKWGGDASTGGLQVKGSRVQEWIKNKISALEASDIAAEKQNPSVFGGFVNNVSLKNTDAGSDYIKVVYDTTRHMFFAVTLDGEVEKYHRQYDKWSVYNNGEFPNAYPYNGKMYLYGANVYVWDGEALLSATTVASEQDVRSIVSNWITEQQPSPEPEPEPEQEEENEPEEVEP
jgi:hypothetical protein